MSISVISTPTASPASSAGLNALSAASATDGGAVIDFAALLSNFSQITDSVTSLKPEIAKESKRILDALSAQDPAQSPQNLLASITPAVENRSLIDVDRNSLSASDLKSSIAAIDGESSEKSTARGSSLLDQLTNRNANPGQTADAAAEKNSKQGRSQLPLEEALPSTLPNIAPAIENRAQIAVDRNSLPAGKMLSGPDTNSNKSAALNSNLSAKATESDSTLASPPPTVLNVTNKSEASLAQSNQPALSTITPTASNITAILAGEANSGNASPSAFATVMANHTAQTQQAQHPAPSSNPTVTTPLQDNRWAQDFSERIVWIARNDQQVAQINISPAQLGPVQITLNINGDQANIAFASPHADVRKAIEDAMPNLREMLSTAGISLGQSNVGAQLQQQQRDTAALFTNGNRSAGETAILPADSRSGSISTGLPIQRGRGLVDLFA
jgi:flagellar hook-length control protein FliK